MREAFLECERLRVIIASPEMLAKSHPEVIYNMSIERFGEIDRKIATSQGPSRRQKTMSNLRKEIKKLDAAVKSAPEEEKEGIKTLQKEKLRDLRLKKRAENVRKNRKKFSRKEMDDLQAFQNFKEAFDHFDWNNTKTIATSVSIEIHISHLKIIVVQMLDLVSKRHSIN